MVKWSPQLVSNQPLVLFKHPLIHLSYRKVYREKWNP